MQDERVEIALNAEELERDCAVRQLHRAVIPPALIGVFKPITNQPRDIKRIGLLNPGRSPADPLQLEI